MSNFDYQDQEYFKFSLKARAPPTLKELSSLKRKPESQGDQITKKFREQKPKAQQTQAIKKPSNLFSSEWKPFQKITTEKSSRLFYDKVCPKEIYDSLTLQKQQIQTLTSKQFADFVKAANPYELIGKSKFMNRSAMKLLEIDHLFKITSKNIVFADLCGGPGGFAEYILNKQSKSKGYGISLKGDLAFNISNNRFEILYGKDNTGNIYNIDNISDFSSKVLENHKQGVDLALADGGFSVIGDETHQEENHQQLILAEILIMFKILKKGGDFCLKMYDLTTPLMIQLVYFLYLYFESITFLKLKTSRPGNSERYLVCKGLQEFKPLALIKHLTKGLEAFEGLKPPRKEVVSGHLNIQAGFINFEEKIQMGLQSVTGLLDMKMIETDERFVDLVENFNTVFYCRQRDMLKDVLTYKNDPDKLGWDQEKLAKDCLEEWGVVALS